MVGYLSELKEMKRARTFFAAHPKVTWAVLGTFFAFLAVVGQVGENVSLPLWADAASSNCSYYKNNTEESNVQMENFFILSFASMSFVIVFGICTLVVAAFDFKTIKENLKFPQWQLVLIGVCDALNGILVVFSASPRRTAPFLQAILGNIVIPLTIVLRFFILRKKPTLLKLAAAGIVCVGLIMSLIPVIGNLDKDSDSGLWQDQSTAGRILWPLCFMIGFLPATVMNVVEEMSLKDSRKVNLFYLLFWTSLYQVITIWLFFWVDILPSFGYADNIHQFGENYKFALACFFGGDTCDAIPGIRGTSFIVMYILAYIGSGLLLRYAEGATYLAIVQALVTPLGALFWSVFDTDNCGGFFWSPHADYLTYFSIAGIVLIVPAILLYNIEKETIEKWLKKLRIKKYDAEIDEEKKPLLN